MKTICTYALFLVFLVGCVGIGGKQSDLEFQASGLDSGSPLPVGASREQSLKAFQQTVYPIVKGETCVACHNSETAGQQPVFADDNVEKAFDAIIMTSKVNLLHPADSRIVAKVKSSHNCWTNDCNADAAVLLDAIKEWARLAPAGGVLGAGVTDPLSFPNTFSGAQAEYGTIVLQAEQVQWPVVRSNGVLREGKDGRFVMEQDSLASDGKYLEFAPINPHPAQARRSLDIDSNRFNNCEEFDDARDLATGSPAIRIRQQKVHNPSGNIVTSNGEIVNDGYIPKIAKLQFNIIRPDKRIAYAEMLTGGNFANVNSTLLTTGFEMTVPRTVGSALGGMGTNFVLNQSQTYLLPKFKRHSDVFDASGNFKAGTNLHEVFKDAFAENGTSIRNNLRSANFRNIKSQIFYKELKESMMGIFYNNGTPKAPSIRYGEYLNNSVTAMMSRDVSVTYQCEVPGCSSEQLKFTVSPSGPVLTQANALTCYKLDPHPTVPNQKVFSAPQDPALCDGTNPAYFHLIDAYVYVSVQVTALTQRAVNNFSTSSSTSMNGEVEQFNTASSQIFLNDLADEFQNPNYLYTNGANAVTDVDSTNNFAATTHMVLKSNCMGCHGNGTAGLPQFAVNNASNAFQVVKSRMYIKSPTNTSFRNDLLAHCNQRLPGQNCNAITAALYTSIDEWKVRDAQDGQSNSAAKYKKLTREEKLPGRMKFKFKISEGGKHNVWARLKNTSGQAQLMKYRLLNSNGTPVMYSVGLGAPGNTSCYNWSVNTSRDIWEWSTPGRNDEYNDIDTKGNILFDDNKNPVTLDNNRVYFDLTPGEYTLDMIAFNEGFKVDLVAVNRVPDITKYQDRLKFQPDKRAGDFKNIADYKRRVLKYDISRNLKMPAGEKAFFEIEVKKEFDDANYVFRNPRFYSTNDAHISVKGIKVLINGKWNYPDSTYNNLSVVVGDGKVITYAPLVALVVGPADAISFQFDELKLTTAPLSILYPNGTDAPTVSVKHCNELDFFKKNVMPILKNVRVMLNASLDMYLDQFPGSPNQNATGPGVLNCVSCHTQAHPYFKMATFANDDEFCREALSRVDFDNYYQSLVIRGINGTGVHPKFVFTEKFVKVGENFKTFVVADKQLNRVANDPNGVNIASELVSGPMQKWTYAEIDSYINSTPNLDWTATEIVDARAKAGMFKRIRPAQIALSVVEDYDWFLPERDLPLFFGNNNTARPSIPMGAYDVIQAQDGYIDVQRRGPLIFTIDAPNPAGALTAAQKAQAKIIPTTNFGVNDIAIKAGTTYFNMDTTVNPPVPKPGAHLAYDKSTIDFDAATPGTDARQVWIDEQEALRSYYRETVIDWIRKEDAHNPK